MPHSPANSTPFRNASEPLTEADRKALALLEEALCSLARNSGEGCRGRFALAYSGGMDSRFLAHAARLLGFEVLLLMAAGPHVPPEEEDFGEAWARSVGLPLRKIALSPLSLPLVASNDRRRCYACKKEIFSRLLEELTMMQADTGEDAPLPLCDGSNASDALVYRPGTQAVHELGIRSPLAQAGLTKADIYRLAARTGMERPDQKPRPCLLTRLPYGMAPEEGLLRGLAAGERAVRLALEEAGILEADFRLRLVPQGGETQLELHLLRSDAARLPPELEARLPGIVAQAAPQLPALMRIDAQDSLSGFFDKRTDNA